MWGRANTSVVMTAFLHLAPGGMRFNNGGLGAWKQIFQSLRPWAGRARSEKAPRSVRGRGGAANAAAGRRRSDRGQDGGFGIRGRCRLRDASARSMTPMATLATARLAGRRTPGRLVLLDHPLFKFGALAMGVGELFGDKMTSAPDRTVFLGLLARVLSGGIAGGPLAPRGRERAPHEKRGPTFRRLPAGKPAVRR